MRHDRFEQKVRMIGLVDPSLAASAHMGNSGDLMQGQLVLTATIVAAPIKLQNWHFWHVSSTKKMSD